MTIIRSFLFIPTDSDKKLSKGDESGADALILDLEDSVAFENKAVARQNSKSYLEARPQEKRQSQLWVRVNGLDTDMTLDDLASIVSGAPDGIMLPKANGPEDVRRLSHYLDALEAAHGLEAGRIRILPVATETALAPFNLGEYAKTPLERLYGLTWGAEDLSAALSASTNLNTDGRWAHTYMTVRSLTLMAAHAADVHAVETLYANYKDSTGLAKSSVEARAEGFSGRLAIHPAQVKAINESFTPSKEEIAYANRVIAAFAEKPGAGTIGLDGKMLDIPHLKAAEKTLQIVEMLEQ